jgi:hypothetical protein
MPTTTPAPAVAIASTARVAHSDRFEEGVQVDDLCRWDHRRSLASSDTVPEIGSARPGAGSEAARCTREDLVAAQSVGETPLVGKDSVNQPVKVL